MAQWIDNTTKFQEKFDLYEILRESGVDVKDTRYILGAVQEYERLSESVRLLSDECTRRLNAEERMTDLEQRLFESSQENKTEFEQYKARLAVRDKEIEESKLLNHKFAKEIERIRQMNEKLKEALRECDPYTAHTGSCLHVCEFCLKHPHSEDCEYVRLCGEGGKNVKKS